MQAAQIRPAYAGVAQLRKERRRDKLRNGPTHRLRSASPRSTNRVSRKYEPAIGRKELAGLARSVPKGEGGSKLPADQWPSDSRHVPALRETGTTLVPKPGRGTHRPDDSTHSSRALFSTQPGDLSSTETPARRAISHRLL